VKRKQGERWAGYRASKIRNRGADAVTTAEGNTAIAFMRATGRPWSTGGQAAVNPAAGQGGVVGFGQAGSNEIGAPSHCGSLLCSQPTDVGAERISVFSLRVLVVV
jgi:hypothetical protein